MTWGLMIVLVLLVLFIFALLTLGEGLLKVAASQNGVEAEDYSVMPNTFGSLLGKTKKKPKYVQAGAEVRHLSKGFDIKLAGVADVKKSILSIRATRYSIKPTEILPKGVYQIRLQCGKQEQNVKWVVQ